MTAMTDEAVLNKVKSELARVGAHDASVALDYDFEPETGPLARLQIGDPYWHFLTSDLLQLIESLPDGSGSEALQRVIEQKATTVWHGPAPEGSRDTSF